jgi:hypothetical protein
MSRNTQSTPPQARVNDNGLTFARWYAAANRKPNHTLNLNVAYMAWINNEDPTDYAV